MNTKKCLFFHPESESYFIENDGFLGDGLCEDVTLFKHHIEAAAKKGVVLTNELGNDKPDGKSRKLLEGSRHQLILFVRQFEAFLAHNPAQLVKSCLSCDHFNEPMEQCSKANARPPAKIIAFGCEAYDNVDDDIPF